MTPPELIAWNEANAEINDNEFIVAQCHLNMDALRLLEDVLDSMEYLASMNDKELYELRNKHIDRFNELFKEQGEQL